MNKKFNSFLELEEECESRNLKRLLCQVIEQIKKDEARRFEEAGVAKKDYTKTAKGLLLNYINDVLNYGLVNDDLGTYSYNGSIEKNFKHYDLGFALAQVLGVLLATNE